MGFEISRLVKAASDATYGGGGESDRIGDGQDEVGREQAKKDLIRGRGAWQIGVGGCRARCRGTGGKAESNIRSCKLAASNSRNHI